MQVIEDEVIGELRYLTVEFDQAELLAGHIGVISQGAVRRYFEGKSPDLKVKKCGGLKLDSQRDIVTMRIGVVKKSTTVTIIDEFAGPDNDYSAAQKLLNPGYDELKTKHDNLLLDYQIQSIEVSELKEKYDALVTAVSKDAQKFSDLLVENEKLKAATDSAFAECPHCVENKKLRAALQSAQTYYENDEYGNMGRIFEQTLKEDSADLGPDIGSKEIKDIADAMSKPPRIKPLGLNSAGEYLGLHGSD